MFIIVYKGNVILGPMKWNARRYTEVIQEDCEIDVVLDLFNDDEHVVVVNEDITIYPVVQGPVPEYNTRMEMLYGPFYEYTDTHAISTMRVASMPLEAIQNFMRQEIATTRWNKQNSGVDVEINSVTYTFATDEQTRSTFHQYVTSGIDALNWKVNQESWIQLSNTDINAIFNNIIAHIQSAFDWESSKNVEITNATLETIESISTLE